MKPLASQGLQAAKSGGYVPCERVTPLFDPPGVIEEAKLVDVHGLIIGRIQLASKSPFTQETDSHHSACRTWPLSLTPCLRQAFQTLKGHASRQFGRLISLPTSAVRCASCQRPWSKALLRHRPHGQPLQQLYGPWGDEQGSLLLRLPMS